MDDEGDASRRLDADDVCRRSRDALRRRRLDADVDRRHVQSADPDHPYGVRDRRIPPSTTAHDLPGDPSSGHLRRTGSIRADSRLSGLRRRHVVRHNGKHQQHHVRHHQYDQTWDDPLHRTVRHHHDRNPHDRRHLDHRPNHSGGHPADRHRCDLHRNDQRLRRKVVRHHYDCRHRYPTGDPHQSGRRPDERHQSGRRHPTIGDSGLMSDAAGET